MATGRLGGVDITTTAATSVYTCPTATFGVVSVSICNRSATAVTVRLALTVTGATPATTDYLEYDEDEHTGTYFVNPVTDPITDLTNYSLPNVHEGAIVIVPSNVLHFTYPNKSNKIRIVMGFDIKFEAFI